MDGSNKVMDSHAIGVLYKEILSQCKNNPFKVGEIEIQWVSGDRVIMTPGMNAVTKIGDSTIHAPIIFRVLDINQPYGTADIEMQISEDVYFELKVPAMTKALVYFYPAL